MELTPTKEKTAIPNDSWLSKAVIRKLGLNFPLISIITDQKLKPQLHFRHSKYNVARWGSYFENSKWIADCKNMKKWFSKRKTRDPTFWSLFLSPRKYLLLHLSPCCLKYSFFILNANFFLEQRIRKWWQIISLCTRKMVTGKGNEFPAKKEDKSEKVWRISFIWYRSQPDDTTILVDLGLKRNKHFSTSESIKKLSWADH